MFDSIYNENLALHGPGWDKFKDQELQFYQYTIDLIRNCLAKNLSPREISHHLQAIVGQAEADVAIKYGSEKRTIERAESQEKLKKLFYLKNREKEAAKNKDQDQEKCPGDQEDQDQGYITPADLQVGDTFCEDTYPEVWQVITCEPMEGFNGVRARCVGYISAEWSTGRVGEECDWFGEVCLYKISKYFTPYGSVERRKA